MLSRKSKLAILKFLLFVAFGILIMSIGNIVLWKEVTIEHALLYAIIVWTTYALLRDLVQKWGVA